MYGGEQAKATEGIVHQYIDQFLYRRYFLYHLTPKKFAQIYIFAY